MFNNYIYTSPFLMLCLLVVFFISTLVVKSYAIPTIISITCVLFTLYFFRGWTKSHDFVVDENVLYCPCDGIIKRVIETPHYFHVMIFLNIHNIHVQYSPFNCKVRDMKYFKGTFYPAYLLEKSEYNERQHYILSNKVFGDVVFTQIAGQIARRIQSFVEKGESITTLEPLGIIKFGSRCDLVIKKQSNMNMVRNIGDRVHIGDKLFIIKK